MIEGVSGKLKGERRGEEGGGRGDGDGWGEAARLVCFLVALQGRPCKGRKSTLLPPPKTINSLTLNEKRRPT